MTTSQIVRAFGFAGAMGIFCAATQSQAFAGKPPRQVLIPVVQIEPTPMPVGVIVQEPVVDFAAAPCCEHKCCKHHERKCKHTCGVVVCAPTVEYKGCPTRCGITKLVRVTHPKTCQTVEVPVQVPVGCRERVDRDRDGDLELDYGKYEVTLRWHDGGRRLVVHYDD